MLHTFDVHRGNRDAGEGGQKYAAQGIAQRMAETALQRLDYKPAVAAILANFHAFDAGLFDFDDHFVLPSISRPGTTIPGHDSLSVR